MIYAVNYADSTYRKAQLYNTKTAMSKGQVDRVLEYGPDSIDSDYIKENESSFLVGDPRVGKYGLWRPWILKDAFDKMQYGDYLVYCDSGAYYIQSVYRFIQIMEKKELDLLCFEVEFKEKTYTKRDAFIYMASDTVQYTDSLQRCSTYMVYKKTVKTENFINEYLELAKRAPFLFTDAENQLGSNNYPEFIDHRHNQSVFSLLTKKYGYPAFRSPDQWGEPKGFIKRACFTLSQKNTPNYFPMVFVSHRTGYIGNKVRLKVYISYHFPRLYIILYKYNIWYPIRDFLVYIKHKYISKDYRQ